MKRKFRLIIRLMVLMSFLFISNFVKSQDEKTRVNINQVTQQDEKGVVRSFKNNGNLFLLGNVWQVTECCGWTGIWTRRPNTNVFDCVWKHSNGSQANGTVEISGWNLNTNMVTISRPAMNGVYTAKYNSSAKTLSDGTTTWYPAGSKWSAVIR